MADDSLNIPPRIEALKRKYDADPSSTVFLQLAEEYRKHGMFDEAILICEDGLKKHPNYTSAHVALGRALMGAEKSEQAQLEFEKVLKIAPDNIKIA